MFFCNTNNKNNFNLKNSTFNLKFKLNMSYNNTGDKNCNKTHLLRLF